MMVLVAIPGERWKVEFFEDGSVEVEKFVSNGDLVDESALSALFQAENESVINKNEPIVRTHLVDKDGILIIRGKVPADYDWNELNVPTSVLNHKSEQNPWLATAGIFAYDPTSDHML